MAEILLNTVLLLLSVALLWKGSDWLVESAARVGHSLGMSDLTIGLTIVAFGTSAPEFATSLMAAAKGRHGMSLGNLIGSDLFNLLGVLGLAGMIRNLQINPGAFSSVAMLAGMCVLVVVFMRTGWRISRWEGLVLIAIGVVRWILDFLL